MFEKILLKNLIRHMVIRDIPLVKPRGRIIQLEFDPEYTKFNINDYIKLSKKSRRSEKLIDKEKAILQYCMIGKCVFFRKRGLNSSFTIRNVLTLCPFEICYMIFATSLSAYSIMNFDSDSKKLYNRTTLYNLRINQPAKSQVNFYYVVGEAETSNEKIIGYGTEDII